MNRIFQILFLCVLLLIGTATHAQKQVTLKAGTIVSLEALREVRGAKAHEGESVDFRVTRDVVVDGVVVVPAGTLAKGTVYEATRSTVFGIPGKLGIRIRYMIMESGEVINFASSEIYIKGRNQTPVSIIVFLFTCLPLPCGGKAVMPLGFETDASVASNTELTVGE